MAFGSVIRASALHPGDLFETLLTGAPGIRRDRLHATNGGIPVELWYDGLNVVKMLHYRTLVRLVERAMSKRVKA